MALMADLWSLFTPPERWKLLGLVCLSAISSLLELAAVFSIVPFVAILSQSPRTLPLVEGVQARLGLQDPAWQLVFWASSLVAILALVQGCTYLCLQKGYALARSQSLRVSRCLYQGYLDQPYLQHLEGDSSDRMRFLASARRLSLDCHFPLLQLLVRGVSALGLAAVLLLLAPSISLLGASLLLPFWVFYYRRHRKKIAQFHRLELENQERLARKLSETFATLRLVYMHSVADSVVEGYLDDLEQLGRQEERRRLSEELPKWGLHLTSQVVLLSMAILLYAQHPQSDRVLPVVALFALTGYRLIPMLQGCLSSLVSLEGAGVVLQKLCAEMAAFGSLKPTLRAATVPSALVWQDSVRLEWISFSYSCRGVKALSGVDLSVGWGERVALVGETGSGKTTLIQLLCGLLSPGEGQIKVDGQSLDEPRLASWRAGIGYAAQDLELVPGSLKANLTLYSAGEPDQSRLQEVLGLVGLEGWLASLPQGLETTVGERGLRLSGGQRQRLALARALYHQPSLLILDEATSQLSQNLEDEIFHRIFRLQPARTLLCITHRLSILPAFDRIYILKEGAMVASGSYAQLAHSPHLRELGQALQQDSNQTGVAASHLEAKGGQSLQQSCDLMFEPVVTPSGHQPEGGIPGP